MFMGEVKQNIATLTVSNLTIGLIEFVFNLYLSRILGAEGLGLLSLVAPINCLFLSFMTEGLVVTVSKISDRHAHFRDYVAMDRTIKIATAFSFLWSLLLAGVVFACADFIASRFLGDPTLRYPILSTCPLMLLMSISNIVKGHFLGLAKIRIPALINISEKLLRFPILYCLIRLLLNQTGLPPVTLVYLCYAIGELQSVVFLLIYYRATKAKARGGARSQGILHEEAVSGEVRRVENGRSFAKDEGARACRNFAKDGSRFSEYKSVLFPLIRGAAPICLTQCVFEFVNAFSSVIVKSRLCAIGYSMSEALSLLGMYKGMVFPLAEYPMILIGSVCSIVVPKISTMMAAKKERFAGRLLRKALFLALMIGLVTCGVFLLFASDMGAFFYKRQDLTLMIRLAGACAPLLFVTATTTSLLIGMGREAQSFRNCLFQQLLLLIFLLIFTGIPALNIYGYLLSIALSNSVLLVKNLRCLKDCTTKYGEG